MKAKIKDNPNLQDCVFHIVVDGYNAPVTAGNFVDLAERNFYNGMEIQKSDGFCGTNERSRRSCGRIYRSNHRESKDGSSWDYGDWEENAILWLNPKELGLYNGNG